MAQTYSEDKHEIKNTRIHTIRIHVHTGLSADSVAMLLKTIA